MSKIVLSYRRDDAKTITNWLYEKLIERYGIDTVFRDIDSIQPTENFKKRIGRALKDCDFVVAVVGPNWQGAQSGGQARINAPNDWVRVEVETALQLDIPLLPVLVEDAEMPDPEQLPASLREMTEINALPIASGGARFYDDLNRLFATIEGVAGISPRAVGAADRSAPAPAPVPAPTPPAPAAPAQTQPPSQSHAQAASEAVAGISPGSPLDAAAHPPASETRRGWKPFEARTLLILLLAPAVAMVLFWLWAFETIFNGPSDTAPPILVFAASGLFMAGLGFAMKRKARLAFPVAVLFAAAIGLAVFVAVTTTGYLEARDATIGLLVFVVGGAAAAAAGYAIASLPWGGPVRPA
jgi:hypothetical protein